MRTKRCHICKIDKPVRSFYTDRRNSKVANYQGGCKKCRQHIIYKKDKELRLEMWKLYSRRANKKRRGLTLEQFDLLLEKQNGLCAICGLPEIDKNQHGIKDLAIDHNHQTNKVRGLLCVKCNRALGLFNVDNFGILNLQKAIDYVEQHSGREI